LFWCVPLVFAACGDGGVNTGRPDAGSTGRGGTTASTGRGGAGGIGGPGGRAATAGAGGATASGGSGGAAGSAGVAGAGGSGGASGTAGAAGRGGAGGGATGTGAGGAAGTGGRGGAGGTGGGAAGFVNCRGRALTAPPSQGWRHLTTSAVVATGAANHSAQDVIAAPGATTLLPGKFTYGVVSVDLEDESVRVLLDDCGAWRDLGTVLTNGDGRVNVNAPATLGPGVYELRFQVLGDGSGTTSYLWLLPTGTHVVVSDIDGTLTQSDSQLFMQILDGSHVPVPYPSAVDLTTAHAATRAIVVYLTGRPYVLTQRTRDWLTGLGFAPGPLHVTDSNTEAVPTESGVGAFKLAWLQGLKAKGYLIDFAYGNATTDIFAYLGAGIPASTVWIIGANGGQMGTHAVAGSWAARVVEARALPPVPQPF
jgi:hypothetical protein